MFFKAAVGIRYVDVTGVQTCALPIFLGGRRGWRPLVIFQESYRHEHGRYVAVHLRHEGPAEGRSTQPRDPQGHLALLLSRSEERRVGIEYIKVIITCQEMRQKGGPLE